MLRCYSASGKFTRGNKMSWFYISFARAKSEGGFLGGTVVQADDAPGALAEATRRGLNPGGEAQIIPVPDKSINQSTIVALRNRLASKAELLARGEHRTGYHERGEVVCKDCNEAE
jgi:hypothetical protein